MEQRKRINVVSLKMVKERSLLYDHRQINSPSMAVDLIKCFTDGSDREKVIVIALDTKNQPIALEICSIGDLSTTIVHPREIFKMSILANAGSIIIGHNHPSGIKTPSPEDNEVTDRIKEAGKILGIDLLDHLIVTEDDYYSYKENGVL